MGVVACYSYGYVTNQFQFVDLPSNHLVCSLFLPLATAGGTRYLHQFGGPLEGEAPYLLRSDLLMTILFIQDRILASGNQTWLENPLFMDDCPIKTSIYR